MSEAEEPVVERFRPTNGTLAGRFGLVAVAAVLVASVAQLGSEVPPWLVVLGLLVAALVWAAVLRPRVWATREHLVLRGMVDTVHVPLASIEEVVVRQVLALRAGGKRYVSPAVGRSRRSMVLAERPPRGTPKPARPDLVDYPDFVEERIRQLADEARQRAGVARRSPEQAALAAGVRREWAWPEVVALAVLSVAMLVVVLR